MPVTRVINVEDFKNLIFLVIIGPWYCTLSEEISARTCWLRQRIPASWVCLDSSLQQYAFEQWQLSGVDLLQLSSQQLHQLGVHKLGHQELVLEAVEKLCSLTYGLGGESLRSLTEKLRAVAHSLQMGIQSRWRVNTYDGQSATKLPASVLQDVVELITAAKGLFFLLNRYQHTQISGCTGSQNIIPLCKDLGSTIHKNYLLLPHPSHTHTQSRQLVAICDEILSSAPEGLLTHATQLQSVELVPTIPGQQLVLAYTFPQSCDYEVIQVNDQIVVGWSRKYLEEKLQESPHGISLLLRRMPFSLRRRDERGDSSVSIKRSNKPIEFSFSPVSLITRLSPGTQTALSRRRVSCRELGRPDCDGWLWKKRKESSVFMTQKWQRFWFVLKGATIYWYTSQQEEKAVGLVKIGSYSIESAGEHKRKYVFKMSHPRFQNFFFAADNVTDMSKWINSLITAIQKYRKFQQNLPDSEAECYSETESEEDGSNSPRLPKKKASTKVQSNTLPRKSKPKGGGATTTLPAGGSKAAGAEDEMGDLFNKLKEGGVSLIGQSQPITHDQLRRSFIRRNKNPVINEKIHTLRALQSTLKAKEAELQIINKLLEDSELTSLKFLQWKQCNEELYQEIQKLSAERNRHQTAPPPMAVAGGDSRVYDLSLSDGEQLVDSDVPSDGDSTLVTGHAHSGYADVHGDQTESGSSDKYFYI
uniref:Connector enhancer of kinase suppressor of Ras 1 n=1 Tax=Electrophorus electricus TaxID=8005 RepID=A0A4W4EEJ2_ELEEL